MSWSISVPSAREEGGTDIIPRDKRKKRKSAAKTKSQARGHKEKVPEEVAKALGVIRYSKETSPVIACQVNGVSVNLLVDTGSRLSLIREAVLSRISEVNRVALTVADIGHGSFVGVTGEEIDIRGRFLLQFALGQHKFDHACYVIADGPAVPVDGILGQDVISDQGIDLLTTRKMLKVGEDEIPIWNWRAQAAAEYGVHVDPRRSDPVGVPVRLASSCTIPAMSEVIRWAKVASPVPVVELGVVEAGPLSVHGLAGTSALVHVTDRSRVPLRLANFTLAELTLPRNKNVALSYSAELGTETSGACSVQKAAEPLSDSQIASLFDITHVAEKELSELRQVIRFPGFFARSNLDLGQCGEIKGDSPGTVMSALPHRWR